LSPWTVNIESFQTRRTLLHVRGTLRGSGEPPGSAWLEVRFAEGSAKIPAIFEKLDRSGDGQSTNIEFVLYGALAETPGDQDTFFLALEWTGGKLLRVPMPRPRHVPLSGGIARIRALPWKHYFTRGMRLVRQRQSGLLLSKLAKMSLAFFTSGWNPVRLLEWAQVKGKPLALVIDHDLGGGANLYRSSLMERFAIEGFAAVLLSAHNGILAYQLTAKRGWWTRIAYIDDVNALFEVLSTTNFETVVFNNIISFPAPLAVVNGLSNWLRQNNRGQFLFLVHDHYCICPSWLLLNDAGKYCGIPDASVCASCLPANKALFLDFARGIDIVTWRAAWSDVLGQADEIRCFSTSTRSLLLRAHVNINPERVSVVPHILAHVRLRRVTLQDPGYPVIGVIGHIVHHKGGQVLSDLAKYIRVAKKRVRIVVIGTIEYNLPKEFVTSTGPYRPAQLPELLEAHGVNVGFFPSIVPETFSYVTEEMIVMGLPILAFDLGAPGERVAQYAYGRVISIGSPQSILEAIEELYNEHVSASEVRSMLQG
jgi:glycosyltransferase involved in cell wall biosynthesis